MGVVGSYEQYERPRSRFLLAKRKRRRKGEGKGMLGLRRTPPRARLLTGTVVRRQRMLRAWGGNHLARNCDADLGIGKGKGPSQYDGYCYRWGKYGRGGTSC